MIKIRPLEPVPPLTWYSFFDYATDGYEKTPYRIIYIEARTEKEAVHIFEEDEDLGIYPYEGNFSISNHPTIEEATDYWFRQSKKPNLREYLDLPDILVIELEKE